MKSSKIRDVLEKTAAVAVVAVAVAVGHAGGKFSRDHFSASDDSLVEVGWGVSREEMRQEILQGPNALFWQTIERHSPRDIDNLIDRLYARESEVTSDEKAFEVAQEEGFRYRQSLAAGAASIPDHLWIELLQLYVDMLRIYEESSPNSCAKFITEGMQGMPPEQLGVEMELIVSLAARQFEYLLDARDAPIDSVESIPPPTEDDYIELGQLLQEKGVSADEVEALFEPDSTHPRFCDTFIALVDSMITLEGSAGKSIRFEFGKETFSPENFYQ